MLFPKHILMYRSIRCLLQKSRSQQIAEPISKLEERGLCIHDQDHQQSNQQTVFTSFDSSMSGLHIGSLPSLVSILHSHILGHKTIILIGESTGAIGDPSDQFHEKSKFQMKHHRQMIPPSVVVENSKNITETVTRVLGNYENFIGRNSAPVTIVNNADWYKGMKILEFLRHIGKFIEMDELVSTEFFKKKIEGNFAFDFSDLSYQVLRSFDWLFLNSKYGCRVQIGDASAVDHMTTGRDLIKKKSNGKAVVVVAPSPFGEGYGKTGLPVISLDPEKTPPYQFYQFFLRTADEQLSTLLKLLTFIPISEIEDILSKHEQQPELGVAQKRLAKEVTLLVHGEKSLNAVERVIDLLSGGQEISLTHKDIYESFEVTKLSTELLQREPLVADLMVSCNCVPSKEVAFRKIETGAMHLNGEKITDVNLKFSADDHILPNNKTIFRYDHIMSSRDRSSASSHKSSKRDRREKRKRQHSEDRHSSKKHHKILDEKRHSKWDDELEDVKNVKIKKEPHSRVEMKYETFSKDIKIKKEPESDSETKVKPYQSTQKEQWGKPSNSKKEKVTEKEKINFGLSGKLTEDTNTYKGVVIKYSQPPEARKPKRRWRWYIFKGEEEIPFLPLHRSSAYLIGRDRIVADIPVDHPSCSKQHAVLQYRLVQYDRPDGTTGRTVKPYIIDLESANGTYLNKKRIDSKRYVELVEKDVINFGYSSRDYVLLHEASQGDEEDGMSESPELSPVSMLLQKK